MDRYFGSHSYSLWHLFQDEKRKVIGLILESTLREIQASFHRIYEDNYPMMLALKDMGIPLPNFFSAPLESSFSKDLERQLRGKEIDVAKVGAIAREFANWELEPDRSSLGYAATRKINSLMSKASREPSATGTLKTVDSLLAALEGLDLGIDLWKCQNIFFFSLRDRFSGMKDAADKGDEQAREWLEAAGGLALRLGIKVRN